MSSDTPITDEQVRLHYVRLDGEDLLPVDSFVPFVRKLERENAELKKTLDAQADYQRDLRADRDRLDWLGSHQGLIERWEGDWYCEGQMFSTVRAAIDAAMGEGNL